MNKRLLTGLLFCAILLLLLFACLCGLNYHALLALNNKFRDYPTQVNAILELRSGINTLNDSVANLKAAGNPPQEPAIEDAISGESLMLSFNQYDAIVSLDTPIVVLNPPMLTTEFANEIVFSMPEGMIISINNTDLTSANNTLRWEPDEISQNNVLWGILTYKGCYRKLALHSRPTDMPQFQYSGKSFDKYFYLSLGYKYALKLNGRGEIVSYLGNIPEYKDNDGNIYFDYKLNICDDGNRYYTFYDDRGTFKLLDMRYQYVKDIQMVQTEKNGHFVKADTHDIILINPNHYFLLSYVPVNIGNLKSGNRNTLVYAGYVQEVKDGQAVFEWLSTDYPELLDSAWTDEFFNPLVTDLFYGYQAGSSRYSDYVHLNSIFIDPKDQNIIVSSRQQSSVMKIDRTTGAILWTLGGARDEFGLEESQLFSAQHTAVLTADGRLILYDNGNAKEQTSIKEFILDEENKRVVGFNDFVFTGIYTCAQGSVRQLDHARYVAGFSGLQSKGFQLFTVFNRETGEIEGELYGTYERIQNYRVNLADY